MHRSTWITWYNWSTCNSLKWLLKWQCISKYLPRFCYFHLPIHFNFVHVDILDWFRERVIQSSVKEKKATKSLILPLLFLYQCSPRCSKEQNHNLRLLAKSSMVSPSFFQGRQLQNKQLPKERLKSNPLSDERHLCQRVSYWRSVPTP